MKLKIIDSGNYEDSGGKLIEGHVFEGIDIDPANGNYHIKGSELSKYGNPEDWLEGWEYAFPPELIEVVKGEEL